MNLAILNGESAARGAAWAWQASWQGAALAMVVAVMLWVAGKRLSPAWRYGLWGLVLARMAMPAVVEVGWKSAKGGRPTIGEIVPVSSPPAGSASSNEEAISQARDMEGNLVATANEKTHRTSSADFGRVGTTGAVSDRQVLRKAWDGLKRFGPLVWLAGVAILLARVAWSSIRLGQAVARMKVIADPRVLTSMRECCRDMRIRRVPRARELPGAGAPALVGWIRPSVLLPAGVIDSMDAGELRLIVVHELAHVKRRDLLLNWIATLIAIIHWPNPAVWLVWWRMRVERELACDEMVLRLGRDAGGRVYANTIVKLVEALSGGDWRGRGSAHVPGGAVGILEGKAQIQRRLLMIARFDAKSRRWPVVAAGLGLLVGAMALSGATRAADKSAPPEKSADHKPDSKATQKATQVEADRHAAESVADSLVSALASSGAGKMDDASARTATKLKKAVPQVQFNGQGLSDVIDFMRDVSGVDILVEWPALEAAGITRDAPVTIQLREPTPVDTVLTLIFRSMANGLQFEIDHGVVVISPGERRTATVVRVFDVSDLISGSNKTTAAVTGVVTAPVSGAPAAVTPVPGSTSGGTSAGPAGAGAAPAAGAGGTPSPTGGEGGASPSPSTGNAEMDQLVMLLTATVQPESWNVNGGPSSIGVFKTKLVIKAPESVQKEVANLLEMLRDQNSGKGTKTKAGGF